MIGTSFSEIVPRLVERLETSSFETREKLEDVVHDYFTQYARENEMKTPLTNEDSIYLASLENRIKRFGMPMYEKFIQEKQKILDNKMGRKLWHYIAGAIVLGEVIEAVLTKGRIFSPRVIMPSLILESLIGGAIYWAANKIDNFKIDYSRSETIESISKLSEKLEVDRKFAAHKEVLGIEELTSAEAIDVVSNYTSPQSFFRDYAMAREADPTSEGAIHTLKLFQFESFLQTHIHCTSEKRHRRWSDLYTIASAIFAESDPNYTLGQKIVSNEERPIQEIPQTRARGLEHE